MPKNNIQNNSSNSAELIEFLHDTLKGKIDLDLQIKFLAKFTPDRLDASMLKDAVDFLRQHMSENIKLPDAMDICGTGGSGLARINTSTIAAFKLAELGLRIAKHGNNGAGGRCGSFDLLEKLGIKINLNNEELTGIYQQEGLAFIYARKFYPVMSFFAEARKKFQKPTIFNLLGPLLNPVNPSKQIIGTSFRDQMYTIAEACELLGKKGVIVLCGRDGLDELTLTAPTDAVELRDGKISKYSISPEDFGLKKVTFNKIRGGNSAKNSRIAREILNNRAEKPYADLVNINCAIALYLGEKVENITAGYELVKNISGHKKFQKYKERSLGKMNILKEIVFARSLPPANRGFFNAINKEGISLIAEIKKSSPSQKVICSRNQKPGRLGKIYEDAGADAISVVTEKNFFHGRLQSLQEVHISTQKTPLLCKDFITEEYQIFQAREFGADAILLIAALLSNQKIQKFSHIASSLNMDCLLEIHDEKELSKALKTEVRIIGINNRDLKNFRIDLGTTIRLAKLIPKDRLIISESGFETAKELAKLPNNVDAVLIGTSIMKSANISQKIHEFKKISLK